MKHFFVHIIIFLLGLSSQVLAQITAQGQGGNDVVWVAAGVEQQIGKRWVNKNAVAYSRNSGNQGWNAMEQSGIFTVREELVYKLSKKVKISQGVFYAERNYYDESHPHYLNELRFYPKVYYDFNVGVVKFSQYVRADVRLFSAPGLTAYHKPFALRARYLMKGTFPLTDNNKNFVVGMAEVFFSTEQKVNSEGAREFSRFHYTESRVSVFYRRYAARMNAYLDFGVMAQTWKDTKIDGFRETLMLQVDIILINPFSRK